MAAERLLEVEVSGLSEDVDDDFLLLYFENKRRSGGGAIKSFTRNGSAAIITFSSTADAEGVLSKGQHSLHHVTVQVSRPPPWDLKKVALSGLDPEKSESYLELYVEAVSGRDNFTIVYSAEKTTALVCFQEELREEDFHRLLIRVEEKKLPHQSISAHHVRVCGEILVENIGAQTSMDLLEMYFESKRSGGGAVRSVTDMKNSTAVVSFCDWNVVEKVLCRTHTLQNCQLSVSPYYPDLLGDPTNEREDAEPMEQNGGPVTEEELKDEMMEAREIDLQVHTQNSQGSHPPEMSQRRPHPPAPGPTINSHDEMLRTPHSSDTHPTGPLVTSMSRGDTGNVDSGVASSSVREAEIIMDAAELSFMQKYHHDLLAGMDAVTIFPLEEDGKFGFKVVGDSSSCQMAVEVLEHIMSSVSSRTITLDYPWVTHFLLESEGQSILRDTESKYQCIIDTSHISWDLLDCVYVDPWSLVHENATTEVSPVQSMITDEVPDNPLLHADMEGIKMFASLLQTVEEPCDTLTSESSAGDIFQEGLHTDKSSNEDDSTTSEAKDEELDKVCQMSRQEYQDRQLDEEAQLLLAIQRSMDSQGVSREEEEDELQRALEMSLIQHQTDDTEESLQRALELSLQDQRCHDCNKPTRTPDNPASLNKSSSHKTKIRVLAVDETSIVVAGSGLCKAITSRLNMVSLEGTDGVQNISQILDALEKKHKVKITRCGRELQIQGFLHGPSQCQQELSEIFNFLQARGQAKADVLDIEREEMIDVLEDSEEYQQVVQPFLNTLQDLKLSIRVLQVQRVHNPLLCNQYQLKKLRMVMTDPNIPAERILYHGTTESSAREICHCGFNRSFSGKNATLYGQGVYFAVESDVSARDHFSPPNKDGKKFILVARVLTGHYTQGKENMKTPPTMPNPTGDVPHRYDSLVNNMDHPTVYVIFNDTQAYPEYLITCTKEPAK